MLARLNSGRKASLFCNNQLSATRPGQVQKCCFAATVAACRGRMVSPGPSKGESLNMPSGLMPGLEANLKIFLTLAGKTNIHYERR